MIDPQQLLEIANELATLDKTRPRQAALRRSISTAYYALFHLIVHDVTKNLVAFGPTTTHRQVGETVARWFEHGEMAKTCRYFVQSNVKSKLREALPAAAAAHPASAELQSFCRAFLDLQQARHDADYDISKRLTRQNALTLAQRATQAFEDWQAVRQDPFGWIFGLLLLTGDRIIKGR